MGDKVESFAMLKHAAGYCQSVYELLCAEAKRWSTFRTQVLDSLVVSLDQQQDGNSLAAGTGMAASSAGNIIAWPILVANPRRKGFFLHVIGPGTDVCLVKLGRMQPTSIVDGSFRIFGGGSIAAPIRDMPRWTGALWGQWLVNASSSTLLVTEFY